MIPTLLVSMAVVQTVPVVREGKEIVVQGRPIEQTERALADCVARQCPPDQDIDATLAHAENQFLAGDFVDARTTMLASIKRNGGAAKRYPVAVADLHRANARIAAHLGEPEAPRQGQAASLLALRAGLPKTDSRVLVQRILLADQFLKSGRLQSALNTYRDTAEEARKLGDKRVEGYARFRRAIVYTALVEGGYPEYASSAREAINWLVTRDDPELGTLRDGALLLAARPAFKKGDLAEVERLAGRRLAVGSTRPVLLYAPVVREYDRSIDLVARATTGDAPAGGSTPQWADVGFTVRPDGRVREVEVLRESPGLSRGWLQRYLEAIGQRRYAALATETMRVERYTRVPTLAERKASRVTAAGPNIRVEVIDLTPEPERVQPAPSASTVSERR